MDEEEQIKKTIEQKNIDIPIQNDDKKDDKKDDLTKVLNDKLNNKFSNGEGKRDLLRETYEYFLESKETMIKPLVIAKSLFGSKATKKMINPTLYQLQSLKLIHRTLTKTNSDPMWSLSEGGSLTK